MADNPFERFGAAVFPSDLDPITDEFTAQMVVQRVYEEITRQFGEDVAAKMFAPYGRHSKREVRRREDAAILLRLSNMDKPNVRQLALKLAGPRGQRANWRLLRDPREDGCVTDLSIFNRCPILPKAGAAPADDVKRTTIGSHHRALPAVL